jgi:hypothetical protein
MPEKRLCFLVLDPSLGLILCCCSSLLARQNLFSGGTAWSASMTREPLLHSLEYPSPEGQCLWEDVRCGHNNPQNHTPLVLPDGGVNVSYLKRIAWSGWHGCNGCVSWQKPPAVYGHPALPSTSSFFAKINLFYQLKSASRRLMMHNLWTKTFPIIFTRRTVRPFPHHASITLFLALIDNLAACSNDMSAQKEAAI